IRYDNYLISKRADQSVRFFTTLLEEKKKVVNQKAGELSEFVRNSSAPLDLNAPVGGQTLADHEIKKASIQSNIHRLELLIDNIDKRLINMPSPQAQLELNANIIKLRKRIDELNEGPRDA